MKTGLKLIREGCVRVACGFDDRLLPVCAGCEPNPSRRWARWTFPADPAFTKNKCHKCGNLADSESQASGVAYVL